MQFVDQARILVRGGSGGNGAVAFRREKFVPKGGPSGGDGGDGGSVVIEVDEGLSTLLDFRYRREYSAKNGEPGANKDMYGRAGADIVLRVPGGTQVFDATSGVLLADLQQHGERFVAAKGGKGGRGNIHFATSTDRAPRRSEPGVPGEERELRLELKLLADVGLLGYPNVGKSSFIARVSAARPKIADYPFTTLVPNLGMVQLPGERSFVVADVPGLIEGAHAGAGLGDRFLRHLERTRVLVHLLEVSPVPDRDPVKDHEVINRELALFDENLAKRPQILVLNKIDDPETRAAWPALRKIFAAQGQRLYGASAITGEGVGEVLEAAWRLLKGLPEPTRGASNRDEVEPRQALDSAPGASADSSGGADPRAGTKPRAGTRTKTPTKAPAKTSSRSSSKSGSETSSKPTPKTPKERAKSVAKPQGQWAEAKRAKPKRPGESKGRVRGSAPAAKDRRVSKKPTPTPRSARRGRP